MSSEEKSFLPTGCDPQSDNCDPGLDGLSRRAFLKSSALGASLMMVPGMSVFAGPFDENEYLKYIPADKKLDPAWVKSLFVRGEKEKYNKREALEHIGMPVGGLFAGTVYLSGDGRLWLWDIFNRDQEGIRPKTIDYHGQQVRNRDGSNFVEPAEHYSPFKQGFELHIGDEIWPLNKEGFESVEFEGCYPLARIKYYDPGCPVEVILEAFTPFIPGNVDDSSLPATVMSFKVKNLSNIDISCSIKGFTENPVCLDSAADHHGHRRNRLVKKNNITTLICEALPANRQKSSKRNDILFEDFESDTYMNWTVEGEAFGDGPVLIADIPDYQLGVGGEGERVVNSHSSAPGADVGEKDKQIGMLTSKSFTIERKYINFYIGGGAHKNKTCLNLIINGEIKASITGKNNNAMDLAGIKVSEWEGSEAQIRIIDGESGGWGNVGVDHIVFSDLSPKSKPISELRDYGGFCLSVIDANESRASLDGINGRASKITMDGLGDSVTGTVQSYLELHPGGEQSTDFAFTWYFPNFYGRDFGGKKVGHSYAARFDSALDVAHYLVRNKEHLFTSTRKWVDTWYNSSLPYWLLDRTMANTSTLATTTCYRHKDGRFWAWEGIGCCTGTCTHVWHYAQAVGRLFPEIERDQRERVDFGMALKENGEIGYRALLDSSMGPAFDGQCGRIMGAFREHMMSADNSFLTRNWPAIKTAVQYMMDQDDDLDGILEGSQPNTLDASWYGKISFISSLYIAALRAGEKMAIEMSDQEFSSKCSQIADKGAEKILELFNDEFFIQLEDPEHKDVIGVGTGCYIDQIFGQTWAHWLGMGNIFDKEKQVSALRSLWRYNFVPDVGPFRRQFKAGRWYAMAGDAGLLMCTWPKGGKRDKWEDQWQFMYFNECMSGFEWQAAANMIYEGLEHPDLLENGLAISRAIHDRYNAHLRNPYNEIECSDHYARAMASYGVYQAVCGFNYHGPKGIIEFDPRLEAENFRAAFVTAEGWGSFSQTLSGGKKEYCIELNYGQLNLNEIILRLPDGKTSSQIEVWFRNKLRPFHVESGRNELSTISIDEVDIQKNEKLIIKLA
ncbi:MAG: hypothetical protein HN936_20740 [Bacteroidetes bacterium]|jgi:non-lysosomal glucosylceramidase|nr:hypothetical protein [Bacteroidota bacterium]MBT4401203.1 hypothetical protein [Bacteroidota bacterium]MBT4411755.1 hypothetical protein [Bacteroidota bacterium]MBT7095685.1 hypothetical protein [Bacteroidota bacterium]MBT7463485.1 hypothetical protein [Bacteroidota bacterium]